MIDGMDDIQLLRVYVAEDSQEAFRVLLQRHVNLVYSVAMRKTGNAAMAEEVSQAVFILLFKKAATFKPHTILSGWLYRATCFAANDILKAERRRQLREQEVYETMQNTGGTTVWSAIEPWLDEAMTALSDGDRQAVLLRFFENKSLSEVGATFGISDDTAQKRITRALDRLRKRLARHKTSITVTTLATLLAANAVQAAPVELSDSISNAVWHGGASASLKGLTLATAKGLSLIQWKFAFVMGSLVSCIALMAWLLFANNSGGELVVIDSPKNRSTFQMDTSGSRPLAVASIALTDVSPRNDAEATKATVPVAKPILPTAATNQVIGTTNLAQTRNLAPPPTLKPIPNKALPTREKRPPLVVKRSTPVDVSSTKTTNIVSSLPNNMPIKPTRPARNQSRNTSQNRNTGYGGDIFGKHRNNDSFGSNAN